MVQRPLQREFIVQQAIQFVDHQGLETLTMRRLGTALGVEAMALYRYVSGRDDLLEAMTSSLISELFEGELMQEEPASWEDYLQRVANATRRLAQAHPRLFPLIATRPSAAPWLRPPLRSVEWVESFLSTLKRFDFSDEEAVGAYKAFTSFLIGMLLLNTLPLTLDLVDDGGKGESPRQGKHPQLDLEKYPTVGRLEALLSTDHAKREFDDALDDLIDRIRVTLGS